MRRRLDLAGALVVRPRILFLDEPTTGLDPRSRIGLWDVIRSLVADGTTVLLTTQYLEEADRLADEISVIDGGRVIAAGTPNELKTRVGGHRVVVVLQHPADAERAAAVLARHGEGTPTVGDRGRELQVAVREGPLARQRVLAELTAAGVALHDAGMRRPTLDDVSRSLTGALPAVPRGPRSGPADRPARPAATLSTWAADGWTITHRNLIRLRRSPDMLVFAVLQPVMFVLLFSQVSGGSIRVEGTACTQYLMAGIFGQTVLFGSTFSGEGMARDVKEGIVDRFRTLPMSRSAVLVGRTNADLVLTATSMVIMIGTGLAVGWRFTTSVGSFAAGVGLLLFSGYAFSWVMALVGMSVRSAETVSNASFVILFPLSFISNAFVQSQTLPGPLEAFADWNPVSALVQAARELFGNTGSAPVPDVWPMQHPVPTVLIGSVVLLAVLVPLCLRRFASVSSR